jgi:adenylate kinase
MKLVLLGPPGAGKGTQAQSLSKQLGVPQIAMGDLLRSIIRAQDNPQAKALKEYVDAGLLVPDELIIALLMSRLGESDCQKGFILDGFPRTLPQAKALQEAGVLLDHVLLFDMADSVLIERLSGRRIHPQSGRTYHVVSCPPKRVGLDDVTGEPLVQRADDAPETIRKRLGVFQEQTKPLVGYYRNVAKAASDGQLQLHVLLADRSVKEVADAIQAALGLANSI